MNVLRNTTLALGLLVSSLVGSSAATLTGSMLTCTGSAEDGQILFHPKKDQVLGTNYISKVDRIIRSTNGVWSVYLLANDYEVSFRGRTQDAIPISVPTGEDTYNFVDLIQSRITYLYYGGTINRLITLLAGANIAIATNNAGASNQTLTISLSGLPAHEHSGADITFGLVSAARVAAAGATNAVPFNLSGTYGTDSGFAYDPTTHTLTSQKIAAPGTTNSVLYNLGGVQAADSLYWWDPVAKVLHAQAIAAPGNTNAIPFNLGGVLAADNTFYLDPVTHTLYAQQVVAPGSAKQVTFNQGGVLAADSGFTYDPTTGTLTARQISTTNLVVNGTVTAPATAGATGLPGQVAWDSSFLYLCIGTNSWKRAALSTW